MAKNKTVFEECDVLVVGGGMAGTGAAFEARHWGRDLKIVCVEKANIDRSGAVAQGLYAINCYMGMQWGENMPEDHDLQAYFHPIAFPYSNCCLLYTSPSPRDVEESRMPSSA